MKEILNDIKGEAMTIVNATNTAIAAESGSMPVFGTPFMIALMEKATCEAVVDILDEGETTVGTQINVSHSKASGVGAVITATATLNDADRRKLTFNVVAHDEDNNIIGSGIIERFVVNSEKFLKKVEEK